MTELVYDVVTPARDEAANLPRLAEALAAQSVRPRRWTVVDNGSSDGTPELVRELAAHEPWIQLLSLPGERSTVRGRPIVRAIQAAATEAESDPPDVFVNVDADVSFDDGYFAELLDRFGVDDGLGIASGTCVELEDGEWRPRYNTGSSVWGATRAYRWSCWRDVTPLEERLGWDGIDEIKANARGWRTQTLSELVFRHHRPEGSRDGASWRSRLEQGRTAHYMGYRLWYLALRAVRHAPRDPGALALLVGYADSSLHRRPRCADASARAYLRSTQSVARLPLRLLESLGHRSA